MVYKKKSYKKRVYKKRTGKAKVSKPLKRAIKAVVNSQIETKTINVPDSTTGPLIYKNTVNRSYLAASGVQYLCEDVFKVLQGVEDNSAIGSPNRIGDKTHAIGFKMNYIFHMANNFSLGSQKFYIPFVKIRVTVFTTAFGIGTLNLPLLYDNNFLNTATYVLQPINYDEGFVKTVLFDKVFLIRNQTGFAVDAVSTPNTQLVYGNLLHFQKYIKFNHPLKYADNNSTNPAGTDKPVYIAMTAEIDESFTGGIPPSNTPIVYTTGYTQAWYKDG